MSEKTSILLLLVATFIWGFIGIVTRELSSFGLDSPQITEIRILIPALAMLLILVLFRRDKLMIRLRDVWLFALFGVVRVVSDVLLFHAQVLIPLGISTVLQMTAPYYMLVFSVFLFHEKLNGFKVAALFIGFFGCVFTTGALNGCENLDMLGIVCALLSGLTFGMYCIGGKLLPERGYDSVAVLFWMFLFGTLAMTPFVDVVGIAETAVGNVEALVWILVMGIVMGAVPYYLQIRAMEGMEAGKAGIILLLEAPVAVVVGTILYGEVLEPLNILGIVMVIASIAIMNMKWHIRRRERGRVRGPPPEL